MDFITSCREHVAIWSRRGAASQKAVGSARWAKAILMTLVQARGEAKDRSKSIDGRWQLGVLASSVADRRLWAEIWRVFPHWNTGSSRVAYVSHNLCHYLCHHRRPPPSATRSSHDGLLPLYSHSQACAGDLNIETQPACQLVRTTSILFPPSHPHAP